jgi:hypothetical protein
MSKLQGIVLSFLFLSIIFTGEVFAEMVVRPKTDKVDVYGTFRADVLLPGFEENTFDPEKVRVEAFIDIPGGEEHKVPLFCFDNTAGKGSIWKLRYTPREQGRYSYSIRCVAQGSRMRSGAFSFSVAPGPAKGFLRRSENNPFYFIFDNGEAFFGIGHNIAWVYKNSVKVFERYFANLSGNGGNLTRIWSSSWSFPLEWEKLGHYDRTASDKLDRVVDLAEKYGLYFIFTVDTYGSLMDEMGAWDEQDWAENPYNVRNGGPCEKPSDFFTDPEAIRLYKNRLRYIISRWGYSPHLMAFELWNEYNAPADWVEEICGHIRELDVHGHFITTSHGYPWGKTFDEEEIWELDNIDLISEHLYADATKDGTVPLVLRKSRFLSSHYEKPFIFSEFGIDSSKSDKVFDPAGIGTALHNSIWASSVSRSFGTAMNWWWDDYIRPKKLYGHYKALASFLGGVNWNADEVKYAEAGPVFFKGQGDPDKVYVDLRLMPEDKWGRARTEGIKVTEKGDIPGIAQPNKYLHGKTKKEFKTDQVFLVDYPGQGEFRVKVGTVSQGGVLEIYVDDEKRLKKELPAGSGEGPWEKSMYLKKYDVYQCRYDREFSVTVPRGQHTVTLSNSGRDWIGIERITLTDYLARGTANVRNPGLVIGDTIIFWVQNVQFNWFNTFNRIGPDVIEGAYFFVYGMEESEYRVEWWDTFKGTVISEARLTPEEGRLRLDMPDLYRDLACKIKKVEN